MVINARGCTAWCKFIRGGALIRTTTLRAAQLAHPWSHPPWWRPRIRSSRYAPVCWWNECAAETARSAWSCPRCCCTRADLHTRPSPRWSARSPSPRLPASGSDACRTYTRETSCLLGARLLGRRCRVFIPFQTKISEPDWEYKQSCKNIHKNYVQVYYGRGCGNTSVLCVMLVVFCAFVQLCSKFVLSRTRVSPVLHQLSWSWQRLHPDCNPPMTVLLLWVPWSKLSPQSQFLCLLASWGHGET